MYLTPFKVMARLTFSLLVFLAVTFLMAVSVSAQGFGLVKNDYDRYTQLFKAKKEPNLSHHPEEGNANWRKLYRDHNWKGYAEEAEHREPLLAAQVLMGVYLISFVNHELTYQIDSIVRYKAHFSPALSERIVLDRIAWYMESTPSLQALAANQGMSFYSQDELDRMQDMGRDIDIVARKRMVSGVSIGTRQRAEIRNITNLFHQDVKGWAATYYFMREKFLVLDDLADSFTFNWDEARREEELQKLMESDRVRRLADERTRNLRVAPAMSSDMYGGGDEGYYGDEIGGMGDMGGLAGPGVMGGMGGMGDGRSAPVGLTAEDIEKIKEEMPRTVAEEEMKLRETRHNAYRYIIGVYQGSEFHLETLRKIYRYFSNAAEQGDPIAQYHLALFLWYLGDIMNEDENRDDAKHEAQEWLTRAAATAEWAAGRVEEVRSYFTRESSEESQRTATREMRLEALKKVEEDKLTMIDEVLIKVSQNIGSGNSSGRGGRNTDSGSGMGGGQRRGGRNSDSGN